MELLVYLMAGIVACISVMYSHILPPETEKEYKQTIFRLELAVFALFLFISYFHGRLE